MKHYVVCLRTPLLPGQAVLLSWRRVRAAFFFFSTLKKDGTERNIQNPNYGQQILGLGGPRQKNTPIIWPRDVFPSREAVPTILMRNHTQRVMVRPPQGTDD